MSRFAPKTSIIALATADSAAAGRAAVIAAKVSMCQTIEAAGTKTGGKAVRADIELGKIKGCEIEVVLPNGSEKEVMVDMATGKIINIKND